MESAGPVTVEEEGEEDGLRLGGCMEACYRNYEELLRRPSFSVQKLQSLFNWKFLNRCKFQYWNYSSRRFSVFHSPPLSWSPFTLSHRGIS